MALHKGNTNAKKLLNGMPYKCAIPSSVAKLLVGTKLHNNAAQS